MPTYAAVAVTRLTGAPAGAWVKAPLVSLGELGGPDPPRPVAEEARTDSKTAAELVFANL